jgi:hypothetical protein
MRAMSFGLEAEVTPSAAKAQAVSDKSRAENVGSAKRTADTSASSVLASALASAPCDHTTIVSCCDVYEGLAEGPFKAFKAFTVRVVRSRFFV